MSPNKKEYPTTEWEIIFTEEFPEGPYGATSNPTDKPGKVTRWENDQQVVSRFQDENPVFSEGKMPPPGAKPSGNPLP